MKYGLVVIINLAAITSFGRPNALRENDDSNVSYLRSMCSNPGANYDIKFIADKFKSCKVSEPKPINFPGDAAPMLCLLTLNIVLECCKHNVSGFLDYLHLQNDINKNVSMCPLQYVVNESNFKFNLKQGIEFFANSSKCTDVCTFIKDYNEECRRLEQMNEFVKKHIPSSASMDENLNKVLINNIVQQIPNNKSGWKNQQLNTTQLQVGRGDKHSTVLPHTTQSDNLVPESHNEKAEAQVEIKIGSKVPTDNYEKCTSECHAKLASDRVNSSWTVNQLKTNSGNNSQDYSITNGPQQWKSQRKESADDGNNDNSAKVFTRKEMETGNDKIDISATEAQSIKGLELNADIRNYQYDVSPKASPDEDDEDDDTLVDDIVKPEGEKLDQKPLLSEDNLQGSKSSYANNFYSGDSFFQSEDSHFSAYFSMTISIIIIGYVIYHNKNKIVAYALEGRRNRGGRRRPSSASYRKLDSNLEEAITSNPSHASATNVIY